MKQEDLATEFERDIKNISDDWVKSESFAKGIPIYYRDPEIAEGVIKEYPDGRKEIVTLDANYIECVIKVL